MSDLQTLVNAIPDAQDGNIITSNYHNTVKAALQAMASQLEAAAPGSQTVNLTVQPNFAAISGATAWTVALGVATSAAGSNGFIPLNLPDGATINQMVAIGAQTSPAAKGFASLLVMPLGGTAGTTLILIDLSTGGNPFTLTGSPSVPGLTASALKDMETVQNSLFKYAIQSEVLGAGVTINAFQVGYTTAG
ncbi:MAG TPA: hypothetical protein VMU81_15355 [Acetobacteraceae bacterium]|nr:hypothetical protein [Acetobacteraceae bacterium]